MSKILKRQTQELLVITAFIIYDLLMIARTNYFFSKANLIDIVFVMYCFYAFFTKKSYVKLAFMILLANFLFVKNYMLFNNDFSSFGFYFFLASFFTMTAVIMYVIEERKRKKTSDDMVIAKQIYCRTIILVLAFIVYVLSTNERIDPITVQIVGTMVWVIYLK